MGCMREVGKIRSIRDCIEIIGPECTDSSHIEARIFVSTGIMDQSICSDVNIWRLSFVPFWALRNATAFANKF